MSAILLRPNIPHHQIKYVEPNIKVEVKSILFEMLTLSKFITTLQ